MFRIAFLDSGIGGILFGAELMQSNKQEIKNALASGIDIEFLYLCDTQNAPYGIRNQEEITKLGSKVLNEIKNHNPDKVFIACNTISSQIEHIPQPKELNGKIHLITKPSASAIYKTAAHNITQSNQINISIWATERTILNSTYQSIIQQMHLSNPNYKNITLPQLNIHTYAPSQWVTYSHQDLTISRSNDNIVKAELQDLMKEDKNTFNKCTIGLFCTHFPFYNHVIKEVFEEHNIKSTILQQGSLFKTDITEALQQYKTQNNNKPNKHGSISARVLATGNQPIKLEQLIQATHSMDQYTIITEEEIITI